MFEQIDPLPSAEHQSPRGNRDGKLGWGKRGPDMRGHVVWSFRLMNIALVVFRRDGLKKIFKISLNVWVGIFLNKERRRSVAAKYRQKAGRDILASQPKRDFAGDFDKTFASGLNVKRVKRLAHQKFKALWELPSGIERKRSFAMRAVPPRHAFQVLVFAAKIWFSRKFFSEALGSYIA
jgi:hypothetical protein